MQREIANFFLDCLIQNLRDDATGFEIDRDIVLLAEVDSLGVWQFVLKKKVVDSFYSENDPKGVSDFVIHTDLKTIESIVNQEMKPWKAVLLRKITYKGKPPMNELKPLLTHVKTAAETTVEHFGLENQGPNIAFLPPSEWQKNASTDKCNKCEISFGLFKRKHHCRLCGLIFCETCLENKIRNEYVCNTCFSTSSDEHSKFSPSSQFIADLYDSQNIQTKSALKNNPLTEMTLKLISDVKNLTTEVSELKKSIFSKLWNAMNMASTFFFSKPAQISASIAIIYYFPKLSPILGIFWLGSIFFGRVIRIYTVSLSVIFIYFIANKLNPNSDLKTLDRIFAPMICNQILQLRSVFVKFGQYIGSRADIIPGEWAKTLEKLQDDMPHDSPSYVRSVIPNFDMFASFDYVPLASASIAQVHSATLKNGVHVAVKVQHKNIKSIIQKDMIAFKRIVYVITKLNPKFSIVQTLMDSWENIMMKELDFRCEVDNILSVRKELKKFKLIDETEPDSLDLSTIPYFCEDTRLLLPQPYATEATDRFFMMSFIPCFKLTDTVAMKLHQIDPTNAVTSVVQAYSVQIFSNGLFNADPHPGNVLLSNYNDEIRPVLLDFGMMAKLAEEEKMGYCELLYALNQLSISGLAKAIRRIGYENSQSSLHPERDLEFFTYLFRTTASKQESKKESKDFRKLRKSQNKDKSDNSEEGRYFKQFPESFVFLFRVVGLIRGLCAQLEINVDYIAIMSKYAKFVLLHNSENVSIKENNVSMSNIGLNYAIKCNQDEIIGSQIYASKGSKVIANVSIGECGQLTKTKLTSSTRMPLLSISSIITNCIILNLIEETHLDFETKIKDIWKEFPSSYVTIVDLLSNGSNVEEVMPKFASIELMSSKQQLENLITENNDKFSLRLGKSAKFKFFTNTIILNKIIELVTGGTVESYISKTHGVDIHEGEKASISTSYGDFMRSMAMSQSSGGEEGGLNSASDFDSSSFLLDPCVGNDELVENTVNGIGMFLSAENVTKIVRLTLQNLSKKNLLKILHAHRLTETKTNMGETKQTTWVPGFQISAAGDVLYHTAFGGNVVAIHPGKGLFVTVLSNNLTLDGGLAATVLKHYDLTL